MWTPDITVAAICERDGKFLLVEEISKSSQKIVFNQPAGHLEQGETILSAAIRETLEETCRHFTPEALVGVYRHEAQNGKTYIRFTFCGAISELDPSCELDSDIIRTHWLDANEIIEHPSLRSPIVAQCLNDYLNGARHSLGLVKEL